MHSLIINKLGPISHVELTEKSFMLLTGSQASGKSTIAKAIFFFRTIKDDTLSLMLKKTTGIVSDDEIPKKLKTALEALIREKFLQAFGSSWGMDNDMFLEYRYDADTWIKITLVEDRYGARNYVWIDFSPNITMFLTQHDAVLTRYQTSVPEDDKALFQGELRSLFSDECDIVYIPAGRSMITLLATQLNYIYSTMDDKQKRSIDLFTRTYLENIIKKRPEFENGLQGIDRNNAMKYRRNEAVLQKAKQLISQILKGSYAYNNGDEKLEIDENHYVKINFTSSGQQEVVWILNLLYYYLLNGKKTFMIIEEPESHLFPESQKYVSELISLVNSYGHDILLTTHSPYVLGSINNLLYANQCPYKTQNTIATIIDKSYWVNRETFGAWFLNNGQAQDCIDDEIGMIQNELIDEISRPCLKNKCCKKTKQHR